MAEPAETVKATLLFLEALLH